jgi:hypothetical protein
VRPQQPDLAQRLASYLDSDPAQEIRSVMVTGATIPRLSAAALAKFPIPDAVTAGFSLPQCQEAGSLADSLDLVLWI